MITENGRREAVLVSAEDLGALELTLHWASQEHVVDGDETVPLEFLPRRRGPAHVARRPMQRPPQDDRILDRIDDDDVVTSTS